MANPETSAQYLQQISSDSIQDAVELEIQMLQEIYFDKLNITTAASGRVSSLALQLKPSVGESGEETFVSMALRIELPDQYPYSSPSLAIRAPRGLSEAHIESILCQMRECSRQQLGTPCLYALIDMAIQSLSDNNRPSGDCMICLSQFEDEEQFEKMPCYHFFHVHCLHRYYEHCLAAFKQEDENCIPHATIPQRQQIVCPVCRSELPVTVQEARGLVLAISDDYSTADKDVVFQPSEELRRQQEHMSELLRGQERKGGVINKAIDNTVQVFDLSAMASRLPAVTAHVAVGTADDCTPSPGSTTPPLDVRGEECVMPASSCEQTSSCGNGSDTKSLSTLSESDATAGNCANRPQAASANNPPHSKGRRGHGHGRDDRGRQSSKPWTEAPNGRHSGSKSSGKSPPQSRRSHPKRNDCAAADGSGSSSHKQKSYPANGQHASRSQPRRDKRTDSHQLGHTAQEPATSDPTHLSTDQQAGASEDGPTDSQSTKRRRPPRARKTSPQPAADGSAEGSDRPLPSSCAEPDKLKKTSPGTGHRPTGARYTRPGSVAATDADRSAARPRHSRLPPQQQQQRRSNGNGDSQRPKSTTAQTGSAGGGATAISSSSSPSSSGGCTRPPPGLTSSAARGGARAQCSSTDGHAAESNGKSGARKPHQRHCRVDAEQPETSFKQSDSRSETQPPSHDDHTAGSSSSASSSGPVLGTAARKGIRPPPGFA